MIADVTHSETPIIIPCAGELLLGILSLPEQAANTAVLIIVGGPQYRAGSHRQFVLLARALADAGYPALRFDYRGMGDSTGDPRNFEQIDEDIAAAIDALFQHAPQIERVVLWGLCDAASASLLYWLATKDPRVAGLCLLNPWVRSEQTLAKTRVRYYYGQRLLMREFWMKLLSGKIALKKTIKEFILQAKHLLGDGQHSHKVKASFQSGMLQALNEFPGSISVILGGQDYTAKEITIWLDQISSSNCSHLSTKLVIQVLPEGNHTFSSMLLRNAVEASTVRLLRKITESEK